MRILAFILITFLLLCAPVTVCAEDNNLDYNTDDIINSLPESVKNSLNDMGISSPDLQQLNNLSFDKIIDEILKISAQNSSAPLKCLAVMLAVMLLSSLLTAFKSSAKTSAMQNVLSVCSTLCITASVALPVLSIIDNCADIIKSASAFMLAYVPAIFFLLSASGRTLSGASYYAVTVFMGQIVAQISSKIITPFLKLFFALGITSAVSHNINLSGVIKNIAKIIRWILGFSVTLFSSFLTVKQIITGNIDSFSDRAVKLGLTSFIPVVGAALSEAYKTVGNSVGLLKSGVGIFALISLGVMFLPLIIQCVLWIFTFWAGKSAAELLNLTEPCVLLSDVSNVMSTLFAVILSVMAVFIICTALVLITGGSV